MYVSSSAVKTNYKFKLSAASRRTHLRDFIGQVLRCVLVGFGCEVEGFSARGFWVRLSAELSRFLIQISFRFRKWDWVKYYDMSRGRTTLATMYVLILSTTLKHFPLLRRTTESFLYTHTHARTHTHTHTHTVRFVFYNSTDCQDHVFQKDFFFISANVMERS